jgi:hypothetical protein
MKAGVAALCMIAIVAAFLLGTRFPELFRPAPSSSIEQVRRLDLQRMCADQADKSFKAAGFQPKQNVMNTYTSHYSAKFGKCFVLFNVYDISNVVEKNYETTYQQLGDAFEGMDYGSSFAIRETKGQNVPSYTHCRIDPPGGKPETCRSQAQWEALANRYMRD